MHQKNIWKMTPWMYQEPMLYINIWPSFNGDILCTCRPKRYWLKRREVLVKWEEAERESPWHGVRAAFTSGNLCDREWDLPSCKALIQLLPSGSRSRHTLDNPHASTYPRPSEDIGPWSCGCSLHSPFASLWVGQITLAHLGTKYIHTICISLWKHYWTSSTQTLFITFL